MERAGFEALAHVESDRHACGTLRLNRPNWNVIEGDVRGFSAKEFKGVDLLAGGVLSAVVTAVYAVSGDEKLLEDRWNKLALDFENLL